MISRFNKLVGNRQSIPNAPNDSVEIFAWHHPIYAPAHHVALRVTQGSEVHYLSLSPTTHPNYSGCSLFDLRIGIEGHFLNSYEEELLIQGFRKAWPAIKDALNENQKLLLPTETAGHADIMKKLTDKAALQIASFFPLDVQNELRIKGAPVQVIQLRSLNLESMIAKIKLLKSPESKTKWALWSATRIQEKNTYNCASSVFSVLDEGGFHNLIESSNYLLGIAGGLMGALYAYSYSQSWRDSIKNIAISTLVARGIGGAYDGYTGVQSYLDFNLTKGKESHGAAIALRMLSSTLSGFMGAMLPGPMVPSVIAMPVEMMKLTREAKEEEDARFYPASQSHSTVKH
jgi:hypothetical protein